MSALPRCLHGFRYATHITDVLGLTTMRDAFVLSLTKFTLLHAPASIKRKNVEALKVREREHTPLTRPDPGASDSQQATHSKVLGKGAHTTRDAMLRDYATT